MALVQPRMVMSPIELPPGAPIRLNPIGYVAPSTVGGDLGLAFPAVPFVINSGVTVFGNDVHVAGLRSFQIALQLSAGPGSLQVWPEVLVPTAPSTTATLENGVVAAPLTLTVAEGLKLLSWGAGGFSLAPNFDGRIYTDLRLGFKAVGGNVTVSRFDGLWCSAV